MPQTGYVQLGSSVIVLSEYDGNEYVCRKNSVFISVVSVLV